MISSSKKWILLTSLLSLCISTPVLAKKNKESQYAIPPSKFPGGDDDLPFFIGLSYIYWQPYQTGMNLAVSGDALDIQGSSVRPITEAASGFKVNVSHNLEHDGWIMCGNYTWFYHNPLERANALNDGTTYIPVFSGSVDAYQTLRSKFRTYFQRIDLSISRPQYVGHYLSLKSSAGLLGAWEFQRNFFYGGTNTNNIINQTGVFKQDWWGIGPYVSAGGVFYLDNTWGIYFNTGAGLLLASHNVLMDIKNGNNLDQSITDFDCTTKIYDVEPMVEGGLGLCWEKDNCTWFATVQLGWELQTYFAHNGFTNAKYYSPTGVRGNFSLQGLTLKVEFNF